MITLNESQLESVIKRVIIEARNNNILESIILSENIVDKIKETLRSGLVTAAVVTSLLSSPAINAQEKKQINDLAVKNGIEMTFKEARTVTVNGFGKSMDYNIAKKMAISDAKAKAAGNNGQYNISNFKILNEKYQKNDDGTYYYAIRCSMNIK